MTTRKFITIVLSLLIAALPIAAEETNAPASEGVLPLCQALALVKTGDHQTVTVTAIYTSGSEDSFLYDPQCRDGAPSTWVEFAPKLKNRNDLERVLKQSSNRAYVQFEGEFFGPKPFNPDTSLPDVIRKSGRRYGHMGGYETMLMVHSIKKVDPVPQDVPFFRWPKGSNTSSASTRTTGDELPSVSHADVPLYPPMARIAGISGTVQVEVTVKNGVVANTELKSPAPPILANATLENLKTWRFASDANATFLVTYIYEIENEVTAAPGNPRIEMQLPSLIKITAEPPKLMLNRQTVSENSDTVAPATAKPGSRDSRSHLAVLADTIDPQHADMPSYSPMAKVAQVTGTVEVEVTIKNGVVVQTEHKSSAHPILINATLENLRTWKFRSDTNAKFSVTYIYELEKKRSSTGNPRIEMQLPYRVKITAQPPQTTTNYERNADTKAE